MQLFAICLKQILHETMRTVLDQPLGKGARTRGSRQKTNPPTFSEEKLSIARNHPFVLVSSHSCGTFQSLRPHSCVPSSDSRHHTTPKPLLLSVSEGGLILRQHSRYGASFLSMDGLRCRSHGFASQRYPVGPVLSISLSLTIAIFEKISIPGSTDPIRSATNLPKTASQILPIV